MGVYGSLPPPNPKPQSNQEKNTRQVPREGNPTRYVISMPQNCRGHPKQGMSEKLSQPRGV